MPRGDWALALGLAVATLATRWPYRVRLLLSWDAVQFALALADYDVARHQPHPPGYILYVAGGRLVAAALGDAAASLTVLAVAASAVAVLGLYRLAWTLYGRPAAVVATVGLVVSPLFWANGAGGLSYAVEAALAVAVARAAWALRDGRVGTLLGSALLLGFAGGVRQSILVVLTPLWLGMAVLGFRRWRPILAGLGVAALAVLAWLLPMLWLTGGPERYLVAALELYRSTVHPTTLVGGGWGRNVLGLGEALLLGVGVLLPVLGRGAWRAGWALRAGDPRAVFLALWVGPALVVYTLVHLGQHGYLLTVLPACYLLVGRVLTAGSGPRRGALCPAGLRPALTGAALGGALVGHAAFFTLAPPLDVAFAPPEAPWRVRAAASLRALYRFRLWEHTAAGLREREAIVHAYVAAIRGEFDPGDTALVTELGNPRSYPWFRHVMYYLPEFPVCHLRLGGLAPGYVCSRQLATMAAVGERTVPLPAGTRRLVWVVDHWHPAIPAPPGLQARALPHGRWLYALRLGRRGVEHAGYHLAPVTAIARIR